MRDNQPSNLIRNRNISILLIFAIILVSPFANARHNRDCVKFTETLESTATTPVGPFIGTSVLTFPDEVVLTEFTAALLGSVDSARLIEKGKGPAAFADHWNFPDGNTLTAVNQTIAKLTGNPGELKINGRLSFTGGSGIYKDAYGRARFRGLTQSLPDGKTVGTSSLKGILCGVDRSAQ